MTWCKTGISERRVMLNAPGLIRMKQQKCEMHEDPE
jgi:hypothetical protein